MRIPEGKYISTVKVGEKGQIVIPKAARDMFGIESGDTLVLMADKRRGIAIVSYSELAPWMEKALSAQREAEDESD